MRITLDLTPISIFNFACLMQGELINKETNPEDLPIIKANIDLLKANMSKKHLRMFDTITQKISSGLSQDDEAKMQKSLNTMFNIAQDKLDKQ